VDVEVSDGEYIAHTDGVWQPRAGGYARLLGEKMFSGCEHTTNNARELMAAFTAVDNCPPNSELTIDTASW
jgi:ribonuclease HI